MTVYLVTSLPNIPYIHRIYRYTSIYIDMVLANPTRSIQAISLLVPTLVFTVLATFLVAWLNPLHPICSHCSLAHARCSPLFLRFTHFKTSQGLSRTIYIRCIYGIFGREITKYTVIYSAYIQFWPTLAIQLTCVRRANWKSLCKITVTTQVTLAHIKSYDMFYVNWFRQGHAI